MLCYMRALILQMFSVMGSQCTMGPNRKMSDYITSMGEVLGTRNHIALHFIVISPRVY